jgi:hypothetical protein
MEHLSKLCLKILFSWMGQSSTYAFTAVPLTSQHDKLQKSKSIDGCLNTNKNKKTLFWIGT